MDNNQQIVQLVRSVLSFPQIMTFLEVARCGSFARASLRLSIPRSTVSARVRALEERLNVRLLHRTTRRVTLTEEGRMYMERSEEAIDKLTLAEGQLTRTGVLSGSVRITVPVDMRKQALAQMLGRFVDRHPAVRIDVTVTDEVLDLVANNIDLALRGGSLRAPGLVVRKLGEGRLAFFASPHYIKGKLPGARLTSPDEHVIYDPTRRLPKRASSKMRMGQLTTRNFELAKTLALHSRGIALLPEGLCAQEAAAGTLVRLSYANRIAAMPLYIVMPSKVHLPARVRTLIDFIAGNEGLVSIL